MVKGFEKYIRQIRLSEIGVEGQKKLRNGSVLVVGAGGLGSASLPYLAGAGVGTIGIIDADDVSETNLHRQIIHDSSDIGINKAKSAKKALRRLTDDVIIKAYPYMLMAENVKEIFSEYDFIIDATDNFETKFLINDACVLLKKPFSYAGVIRFNGQTMTCLPGNGPCLRCIFEEIPEKGSVPKCAEVGVLGPVCGVIGSLQASEALKYLTGTGRLLTGKMFEFDALAMNSRIANIPRAASGCRVCGQNADIRSIDASMNSYYS